MRLRHYLSPLFDPESVLLVVDEGAPQSWAESLRASALQAHEQARTAGVADCVDLTLCSAEQIEQGVPTRAPRAGPARTSPQQAPVGAPALAVSPIGMKFPAHSGAGGSYDLAVIAVSPERVMRCLDRVAAAGIRVVLIMPPAADAEHRHQWCGRARLLGLRVLGPGSTGFVRPHRGLNVSCMGVAPPVGDVALVTQSGALGAAMLDWAHEEGTGFSLVAALGVEGGVDLAQTLDFLANDAHTRSVIVYLEAVHAARPFASALRALSLVKPVIVLKGHRRETHVGKAPRASDPGALQPSLTHSGAIAASDAVYAAVFRRAGAVQIDIFAQVEGTARYLAARSANVGSRLGIVSNGRGPAVLAFDQALLNGISVPALDSGHANPADLGFDASPEQILDALRALGEDRGLDALLVLIAPYRSLDAELMARTLAASARRIGLPVFASVMGGERVRDLAHALDHAGIPVFSTPEAAVNAYANVARFHQNQQLMLQMPRPLSDLPDPDLAAARAVIDGVLQADRRLLDEVQSKAVLSAFHVPIIQPQHAHDANHAVALAEVIGYPVVLKALSPDLAHKSAAGGVMLNLHGAEQIRHAYRRIEAAVQDAVPGARFDGVSVQAMHEGGATLELYVGLFRDALWGPVMAFGSGGTAIELIRDTALELPPLNRFLARRLIARSRASGRLTAWLEKAGVDPATRLDAIERVLLRMSEIACELPQVVEVDINPLIVDAAGAVVAADARIVVTPAGPTGLRYSHMAIMPYPAYLEQSYQARNGRWLTIRPIRPEDAEPLQTMVRQTSPQSRYFRFVSTLSELPPKLLLRFTQIDYDREVALVATLEPPASQPGAATDVQRPSPGEGASAGEGGPPDAGEPSDEGALPDEGAPAHSEPGRPGVPASVRIVGVVRYMMNPDGDSCEFAIAILDEWHGQGLGVHLMRTLIDLGRRRGLRRIEGHVLASNYPMLSMMRYLAFKIAPDPDEPDMRLVWVDL